MLHIHIYYILQSPLNSFFRQLLRSSFPLSAPQSIRFGTALTSEKLTYSVSTDSMLPLSMLMEVRVLEHGNRLYRALPFNPIAIALKGEAYTT